MKINNVIIVFVIILIAFIIFSIIYHSTCAISSNIKSKRVRHKCQFCTNYATIVRIPDMKIVEHRKTYDLEPGYAELQTVYCCNECKVIAGGFRTTKWYQL